MRDVVIVIASRTPIGSFMGSFSDVQAKTLGAVSLRETIRRAGIDPRIIDEVIIGNISGTDPKGNPAREAALDAGIPIEVPAFTANKNCASSIKSVSLAATMIKAGEADIMLAGGMENMTRIPYIIRNARKGLRMGKDTIDDLLSDLLEGMGMTAERLAEKYGISRDEQDRFAYSSQMKAAKAMELGAFDDEIVPVDVSTRKGIVTISKDEGVKPGTTLEGLATWIPEN
ncbi:thiolase family protein, partial [Youngiibacter fragilis]